MEIGRYTDSDKAELMPYSPWLVSVVTARQMVLAKRIKDRSVGRVVFILLIHGVTVGYRKGGRVWHYFSLALAECKRKDGLARLIGIGFKKGCVFV